jgi:uncharacterized phage protein (TIGR01671 family)
METMFRAWDSAYNQMYYDVWPVKQLVYISVNADNVAMIADNNEVYCQGNWFYIHDAPALHLMQWIGRCDKHKKPIFQDDIIKHRNYYIGEVRDMRGYHAVQFTATHSISLEDMMDEDMEVIGDIHRNPGLCVKSSQLSK